MSAAEFVPPDHTLERLQEAAAGCRGCPLWQRATQTVFGAGAAPARLMLVGEQPGDKEDVAGEPFVGPAGHVLDEALADAAIERDSVYVTNAVKHFKWIPGRGGKQRLHQKPGRLEIVACRPWLDAELDAVKPAVIVALGATAAQALLGPAFRLTKQRGAGPTARRTARHRDVPPVGGAPGAGRCRPRHLLQGARRRSRRRQGVRGIDELSRDIIRSESE